MARFHRSSESGVFGCRGNAAGVFWVTFVVIFVFLAAFAYALYSSIGHTNSNFTNKDRGQESVPPRRPNVRGREITIPPASTGSEVIPPRVDPIVRDGIPLAPDETKGEVNYLTPPPIVVRKESPIKPDETKGEVNYSSPPPIIKRKEFPIKPEP